MGTFVLDKRWQLAATIGLPAVYELIRGLLAAFGAGDLVLHDPTTTAIAVAMLALVAREIASHRETLGIRQELAAPPPDPDLRAAVRAVLARHAADRTLLAALAEMAAERPAGAADATGARLLEAGTPPLAPPAA